MEDLEVKMEGKPRKLTWDERRALRKARWAAGERWGAKYCQIVPTRVVAEKVIAEEKAAEALAAEKEKHGRSRKRSQATASGTGA